MATRMQQRRGTASQWTSANPVLNAGEMGWESDTNKFKIGDGTNHWNDLDYFADINSTVNPSFGTSIVFEGATADSYETTLQVTDPTADRTITLPNVTGTVITTGNLSDITDIGVFTSTIVMEGSTADAFELTLSAGNPSADRTITFPDSTGTVATQEYVDSAVSGAEVTQSLLAGSGLTWNAGTEQFDVNTTTIQARVADVSDTEIGYLNGVTSAIQTQLDDKSTASKTETLTNKTLTSPKINENVALSATATELNILDGATLSTTELNYVDGVTSAIQTQIDDKLSKTGGTMTGAITLSGAPSSDLHAATKLYVDNVTAGINFHESVHAATTVNLATNYDNGTSGVGATLTADTNRAFTTIDGESVTLGQRVLIKNQTDQKQNGIYTLTTVGSVSVPWVLTRATDADNNPTGEMKNGDFVLVINGTTQASVGYINNSATNPIVIGTDNITYTEFSAGKTVIAGNGLTEATPGILSIDTSITQARVADVSDTEIGYLNGVTSAIQTQLNAKAPTADPTFTGTVTIPNGAALGTPTSVTLTNATGLPISSGVSGLGTGVATFLGTPSSANLISAITDETGTGSLVFGTAPTLTNAVAINPILRGPEERLAVSATAATGTIPLDILTSGILYYTSNASANWTLNVRGSSGATLNDSLATNDSVTVVFFVTNGGTPYYQTGFQIDGSAVTPKWQNGTAPSAGNANSIDIYSYTIVKTGNAAFTAFGSQTRFA